MGPSSRSWRPTIDARSDIYALGVTFWYLLTGRTPFAGRTIEEIKARQTEPLPFEQLKAAHVPAEVVALLKSMLAVDPSNRPQTALALRTAVHRCYVRFEPVARRRQKHLIFAGGGLALTIALVILAMWPGNIRELCNVIQRAVIFAQGDALHFDLPTGNTPAESASEAPAIGDDVNAGYLTEAEIRRRERENIFVVLQRTGWKIKGAAGAAELLGVRPTTLVSRIEKLGLKRPAVA